MRFVENWPGHLAAPFTGNGWSIELARDFWPSEDLWSAEQPVKRRWLKLCYVYLLSTLSQVTFALVVATALIDLFYRPVPLKWWLIGVGGPTLFGFFLSIVFATFNYASVTRASGALNK